MKGTTNFKDVISHFYPGLIDRLKQHIQDSENAYTEHPSQTQESFLWEHTEHVASLALKLSLLERTDPVTPVITALFHDSGKFSQGSYHQQERPEEEDAAKLAEGMLSEAGMEGDRIQSVVEGLTALYKENLSGNLATDIVHDADFLAKFGFLGAANFLMKSALRGKPLQTSILSYLSKELTYADYLPANMRTSSGKKLAKKKKRDSLTFFDGLLDELCEAQIACYKIEKLEIKHDKAPKETLQISLVIPAQCLACGGKFHKDFSIKKAIKCEKLEVKVYCKKCRCSYNFSFCLPELTRA